MPHDAPFRSGKPRDRFAPAAPVRDLSAAGPPLTDGEEIAALRAALAAAADRESALRDEVQHRVRNMLAVIRSIFRRTRESSASQEEFAEHFEGRLSAMARCYSHLDRRAADGADLEDMLRDELLEVHCLDGPNCVIEGPPVLLQRETAELIALTLHELMTNSVKFGAIAQNAQLAVRWSVEGEPDAPSLHFHWAESGVAPLAAAPRPSGFGRQLIEEALPFQLDATASFALKPGGVDCSIVLPLAPAAAPSSLAGERR